MKLTKKQSQLINDIKDTKEQEIYVEGSTQSGKTYAIALGTILYSENLAKEYPQEEFDGAIIGWSVSTMKKNILESKKDSPENLLRRFNSAFNEIQSISTYNYGIVNDDVDKVVEKIENIMSAEECRVGRVKEIYDFKYGS